MAMFSTGCEKECGCAGGVISPKEVTQEDGGEQADDVAWVKPFEKKDQWQLFPEGCDVEWGEDDVLVQFHSELGGVIWKGEPLKPPYEMEFEARRVDGVDFFCGLTFPVKKDELASLILGGWGGTVVGISCINGHDASSPENETSQVMKFEDGQWYKLRLVVGADNLTLHMDGKKIMDVDFEGKDFSLRPGPIEEFAPLSFSTYQTDGQIRGLKWRELK